MLDFSGITQLFSDPELSSKRQIDALFHQLYPEIKKIAQSQLFKNRSEKEITPTVLVNECYIKLHKISENDISNKKHFFHLIARCMRFYLVEVYRKQIRLKNAADITRLTQMIGEDENFSFDVLTVDQALEKLESIDEELSELVHLKFFAGLSLQEIADIFETTKGKINQKWLLAKSLLINLIGNE